MAVGRGNEAKSLKFKVQTGTSDSGNPIYATRTLGSVKPNATNENLYDCGIKLSALQKFNTISVNVSENYALLSE